MSCIQLADPRRRARLAGGGLASVLMALLLAVSGGNVEAASSTIRRFALVVGVNDGGKQRVRLRYAHSDARSVARVLAELGGVTASDTHVLIEPSRQQLRAALERMRQKLAASKARSRRLELVFYYSGHSDERALLLGRESFSYLEVRHAMSTMPADVRIAVLDSCASGTLTRTKGGRRRPPFMVDSSGRVRGHAFLASASATESAQESDRVRGSFFTHYLVSGMRGAADANRDSRVTLNEAYHYAFHETLARTESSRAGPQHPNYDMQLAGSGDLVLTDLRGTSSLLVLAAPLRGRLFIRDSNGRLVAEINKTVSRPMALGVAAGRYVITIENDRTTVRRGQVVLGDGARAVVGPADLQQVEAKDVTVARGETAPPPPPMEAPAPVGPRVRMPVTFTLFPLFGTGGAHIETNLSLGLVGSYYGALAGLDISLGGSLSSTWVRGAQISLGFNYVGWWLRGAQVSLGFNHVSGHARGLQLSLGYNNIGQDLLAGVQLSLGFNATGRDMFGVQTTLGMNYAGGDVDGVQVAVGANIARGLVDGTQVAVGANINRLVVDGGQVAVAFNSARELTGVQVSSGINQANRLAGAQIGIINIGGDVDGAQIGLINIAGQVSKTQIGLVNIAGRSDIPVGLINIVKEGVHDLEIWAADTAPLHVGLKLGGCHLYSIFALGVQPRGDEDTRWMVGLGLGGRIPLGHSRLFLDLDLISYHVNEGELWTTDVNLLAKFRMSVGLMLARHLTVFAGATFNTFVTGIERIRPQADAAFGLIDGHLVHNDEVSVLLWPGLFAGLRF